MWKAVARPLAELPLGLSCWALSGVFLIAVQTNGRACHPVRYIGVTPPKAQHPQPLRLNEPLTQANLESVGIAGHRRGTQRKL